MTWQASPLVSLKVATRRGAAVLRRFSAADFGRRLGWLLTHARDRVIRLRPEGTPRGRVLFSFIIEPFLLSRRAAVSHAHTHYWESQCMAQTWVDRGFEVDVIRWTNRTFEPREEYDVLIDPRLNLERLAPRLPARCRKIMHIETAHPSVHNAAQLRRLAQLKERRGIELAPFKMIEENRAIENADLATCLGNGFTQASYAFAGKPMHRIPVSAPFAYPFPSLKDFNASHRNWLWFGSEGFVHKGLDLALDVFAGLPDYHLYVCGPLESEPAFQKAFYRELYRTPNIHTLGWVDVRSRRFEDVCRRCLGLIYPTCSEGGGASVLACMHAGLIPLVTREASVDIAPAYGRVTPDSRVETLREQVRELSARPATELADLAREAWSFARAHHTREIFAAAYRDFVARQAP